MLKWSNTAENPNVRESPCGFCGSEAGKRCRTVSGEFSIVIHSIRAAKKTHEDVLEKAQEDQV